MIRIAVIDDHLVVLAGIKALLAVQGKIANVLRLPLVPAREETSEELKQQNDIIIQLGIRN